MVQSPFGCEMRLDSITTGGSGFEIAIDTLAGSKSTKIHS
jgi:hypothetical protein